MTVILYGPRHPSYDVQIATHYGCTGIVANWDHASGMYPGSLHITTEDMSGPTISMMDLETEQHSTVKVVHIHEALRAIGVMGAPGRIISRSKHLTLKVKRLDPKAHIPEYATAGAACFDLHSIESGGVAFTRVFKTGLAFEVPEDHVMLIFSRSGHGFKSNMRLANCVGVIDSDYRGEVQVKLTHDGDHALPQIFAGDRIAQAMVLPIQQVSFLEVEELSTTERGEGGFGSTGA